MIINPCDIESLHKGAPRHAGKEKFLQGPIPWNWLSAACSNCGKSGAAIRVGLVLWFLSGVHKHQATIKLSSARMRELGLTPSTWRRGLIKLEDAGLVEVDRKPGCLPVVTLLAASDRDGNS